MDNAMSIKLITSGNEKFPEIQTAKSLKEK